MSKNGTQRRKIQVTFAITAVPSRRKIVHRMLEQIGDGADVEVMWDVEKKGIWWNVKRAWMRKPPHSTHHVVMSDDLLFCKDFAATVDKIVSLLPDKVISLYTPRAAATEVEAKGKHWIIRNSIGGPTILLPAHLVLKFLLFDEKYNEPMWDHRVEGLTEGDDLRLRIFMLANNLLTWYPVPSLAQHTDLTSNFGYVPGRNSHVFRGTDISLLDIDWSIGIDEPVKWTGPSYKNVVKMFKGKVIYE